MFLLTSGILRPGTGILGDQTFLFFKRLYLRDPLTDFSRNTRKMILRVHIFQFYEICDEHLSAVDRKFIDDPPKKAARADAGN